MRIAGLLFASVALAGTLVLGGCADGGMFDRSSSAARPAPAQRAAAQPQPSADLRESQQQLKSLGLYDGAVDGLWGPETQAAVERYQRQRGLSATGRIDAATRASLDETTAGRSGTTTGQADAMEPARDPQAPITLTNETDVRTVQNRLAQLNYYQDDATGIWGSGTQVAVENFQRARGLPVGQLNLATLNAMGLDTVASANRRTEHGESHRGDDRMGAEADIAPAAGPGASAIAPRRLSRTQVRDVQQRLADDGLYDARVDGIWGARSQRALVSFQAQNGLRTDGRIDGPTAEALGLDLQRLSTSSDMRQ